MYKIEHTQNKENDLNYIELKNSNKSSYAKIHLNLGGSLQVLTLNKNTIIKDLHPLQYNFSYASAILFPFANRIKNGVYTFQKKSYTLDLNLKEGNNALHGLVYNKKFSVVEKVCTKDSASVILKYDETKKTNGFPYSYTIFLIYTLCHNSINLEVSVKNNDLNPFPFNIGWHPYFWSGNLFNSFLTLDSEKKLSFDKDMIPVKIKDITFKNSLQIKDRKFDDCYILNSNTVNFKTPDYDIDINSSIKENYLQVFTPNRENTIAIEPITGPSNSFNNKLGLQILDSEDTFSVNWTIKLKENE